MTRRGSLQERDKGNQLAQVTIKVKSMRFKLKIVGEKTLIVNGMKISGQFSESYTSICFF